MGEPIISDIEDNYPDYLDDTLGYQWDTWDRVTKAERSRHDALLRDVAFNADLASLSNLDRWAVCRAATRRGESELFLDSARLILACKDDEYIAIDEVFVVAIEKMADGGLFDEAILHLQTLHERAPDHFDHDRLQFVVLSEHDPDAATTLLESMLERATDDVENTIDTIQFLVERDKDTVAERFYQLVWKSVGPDAAHPARVDLVLIADAQGW